MAGPENEEVDLYANLRKRGGAFRRPGSTQSAYSQSSQSSSWRAGLSTGLGWLSNVTTQATDALSTAPDTLRKASEDVKTAAATAVIRLQTTEAENQSLQPGAKATLRDLKAAAGLNGEAVTLVRFDNMTGRWSVRLDSNDQTKTVRPEHLEMIKVAASGSLLQRDVATSGTSGATKTLSSLFGIGTTGSRLGTGSQMPIGGSMRLPVTSMSQRLGSLKENSVSQDSVPNTAQVQEELQNSKFENERLLAKLRALEHLLQKEQDAGSAPVVEQASALPASDIVATSNAEESAAASELPATDLCALKPTASVSEVVATGGPAECAPVDTSQEEPATEERAVPEVSQSPETSSPVDVPVPTAPENKTVAEASEVSAAEVAKEPEDEEEVAQEAVAPTQFPTALASKAAPSEKDDMIAKLEEELRLMKERLEEANQVSAPVRRSSWSSDDRRSSMPGRLAPMPVGIGSSVPMPMGQRSDLKSVPEAELATASSQPAPAAVAKGVRNLRELYNKSKTTGLYDSAAPMARKQTVTEVQAKLQRLISRGGCSDLNEVRRLRREVELLQAAESSSTIVPRQTRTTTGGIHAIGEDVEAP